MTLIKRIASKSFLEQSLYNWLRTKKGDRHLFYQRKLYCLRFKKRGQAPFLRIEKLLCQKAGRRKRAYPCLALSCQATDKSDIQNVNRGSGLYCKGGIKEGCLVKIFFYFLLAFLYGKFKPTIDS